MAEDLPIVVIDNGSGMVKAGIAGEDAPSAVFPAIVGRPRNASTMQGVQVKSEYIGDEAQQKRGILELKYPIAAGIVTNWDDMEKVWQHTFFNELRVTPSETQGVLLTEAPMNPKANREKMVSIMFESFNVPNCYVQIQAVLSLYAVGRTTGLVVDSGDGVSHTVPVFEGFSIPHAISKMEIAGRVLTTWCQKLLLNHGHNYTSSAELEIVKDIKEKTCYVADNFEEEKAAAEGSSAKDVSYTLPDKSVITVKAEVRMACPELLFQPSLDGKSCKSVVELTMHSVNESDIDVRKSLFANIILSGGTTMYENLPQRLKAEVTKKAPAGSEVKIVAQPDRSFAVWAGGSTLASLSTFASSWVTAADYEEHGAAIVHRKCN